MGRTISIKIGSLLDAFSLGYTKPDGENTGAASGLPTLSGTQTMTTNGQIIENKYITGRVLMQGQNQILRNCFVVGTAANPSSSMGIVSCNYETTVNALIERCTIVPQTPHYFWDGIQGHDFTALRNNIYGITDGIGLFHPGPEVPATYEHSVNAYILGNYIHDHGYRTTPSNVQSDLHTHNDGIQIHGGYDIHIEGNNFQGFTSPAYSDLTNPYAGSGNQITGQTTLVQTTRATINNLLFLRNWYDGGGEANIHFDTKNSDPITNAIAYQNRFGRNQRTISGTKYTIRRRATLIDLDAPVSGANMNYFEDDGSPITVVIN